MHCIDFLEQLALQLIFNEAEGYPEQLRLRRNPFSSSPSECSQNILDPFRSPESSEEHLPMTINQLEQMQG